MPWKYIRGFILVLLVDIIAASLESNVNCCFELCCMIHELKKTQIVAISVLF